MDRLGVALHPGFSLVSTSRVEADVRQRRYDLPLLHRLQSAIATSWVDLQQGGAAGSGSTRVESNCSFFKERMRLKLILDVRSVIVQQPRTFERFVRTLHRLSPCQPKPDQPKRHTRAM